MTKTNAVCGYCDKIIPYQGRGRPQATCDNIDCMNKHRSYVSQPTATCPMCSRAFNKGPGAARPSFAVFCSNDCKRIESMKRNRVHANVGNAICIYKACTAKPKHYIKGGDYCSEAHFRKHYPTDSQKEAEKIEGWKRCTAPHCNVVLMGDPIILKAANRFCSGGCRHNNWCQRNGHPTDPTITGKAYDIALGAIRAPAPPRPTKPTLTIPMLQDLMTEAHTMYKDDQATIDYVKEMALELHLISMCHVWYALSILQVPNQRNTPIDLFGYQPRINMWEGGLERKDIDQLKVGVDKNTGSFAKRKTGSAQSVKRGILNAAQKTQVINYNDMLLATNKFSHKHKYGTGVGTIQEITVFKPSDPVLATVLLQALECIGNNYVYPLQLNSREVKSTLHKGMRPHTLWLPDADGAPTTTHGMLVVLTAALISQAVKYSFWCNVNLNMPIESLRYEEDFQTKCLALAHSAIGRNPTAGEQHPTVNAAKAYLLGFLLDGQPSTDTKPNRPRQRVPNRPASSKKVSKGSKH